MHRHFQIFLLGLALTLLVMTISCNIGKDKSPPNLTPQISNTPAPTTPVPRSYLEKRADDIGVKILPNGRLRLGGRPADIVFLQLLAFWNAQAHAAGNVTFYPYKAYGSFAVSPLPPGTRVHYAIQFNDDDFGQLPSLESCTNKENAVSFHDKFTLLLECLNDQAAAKGREYKLKAWYEEGKIYIMIHFSFDMPLDRMVPENVILAKTHFPVEAKKNTIIADIAVEFAKILEKGEELAIVALDFIGPIPNEPELVYLFDKNAIVHLKELDARKVEQDWMAALEFANVQERRFTAEQLIHVVKRRSKEPLTDKEIEIVARIAQETARILRPTLGIDITIYDFKGRAPKDLRTWVYVFDGFAVTALREKNLAPKEILAQASIVEQHGELIDGRVIPPVKSIIREGGPASSP